MLSSRSRTASRSWSPKPRKTSQSCSTSRSSSQRRQYTTQTRYPTTDNIRDLRMSDASIKTMTKIHKPSHPLRIAFFGASDITPPILDTLIEATDPNSRINLNRNHRLVDFVDVITSPPVQRLVKKQKFVQLSPLAEHAQINGIHTEWYSNNPETPFKSHFELTKQYDLAIVFSFPKLIPQHIIEQFPMGMINIHPSIIPLYRGASPIQAAIANNDRFTGVSIMTIEPKKFDVGRVLSQHVFEIPKNTTLPSITPIVTSIGSDMLLDVLDSWDFFYNNSVSQQYLMEEAVKVYGESYVGMRRYAPKYGSIIETNWAEQSAEDIDALFRGLVGFRNIHSKIAPKPHIDKDGNIKPKDPQEIVLKSITLDDEKSEEKLQFAPKLGDPGHAVYDPTSQIIRVNCKGDTFLVVKEIQGQSGKVSTAKEISNGFFNKNEHGVLEGRFM